MEATPSTVAGRVRKRRPPERAPRGPNAGDVLTVDPKDRKRRANAALLELVVEQAVRRQT